MKKGFSLVIIISVLSIFGAALLGYIGYMSESSGSQDEVKGISSQNKNNSGFSIILSSPSTWDFYEYVCKDLDECKKSLLSGKKYASISGGSVFDHELVVTYTDQWRDYQYLKIFMKPSLGDPTENFSLTNIQRESGLVDVSFKSEEGYVTNAVIIPIKVIQESFMESISEFAN